MSVTCVARSGKAQASWRSTGGFTWENAPSTAQNAARVASATTTCERPFTCSACDKSFKSAPNLKRHLRVHTSEKPFDCSTCVPQGFHPLRHAEVPPAHPHRGADLHLRPVRQRFHQLRHADVPPAHPHRGSALHLQLMRKGFSQSCQLLSHQRTHTGERLFTCAQCGKGFTLSRIHLLKHQRTHTGERPYTCAQCGKGSTCSTKLLSHQRTHTSERPYTPTQCGKGFNCSCNLLSHQRTHTDILMKKAYAWAAIQPEDAKALREFAKFLRSIK
ncbi:zinc finger protein 79-like [Amblyraja radiata]|uniref:zinc finger protein 79-like n=1 Tax=Amblyraja radiata TaxID=386614 RepID=UPI0014033647|nr:zinc finger protein 79-like [Amblyraja radiata]